MIVHSDNTNANNSLITVLIHPKFISSIFSKKFHLLKLVDNYNIFNKKVGNTTNIVVMGNPEFWNIRLYTYDREIIHILG